MSEGLPVYHRAVTTRGSSRLGAQLWVERDSTPREIDRLVCAASESGLGLLRIFLVWPWVEPEPDVWEFELYDAVFAAAAEYGLRVKATLAPNTGPWHAGTPGFVQSTHVSLPSSGDQRQLIRRYVRACVLRYRHHPALAQWILWNEPFNTVVPPATPNPYRSEVLRERWHRLVRDRYHGDLRALNRRWHTGYASFDEIPFPEDVPHPAHRSGLFYSFDPWLAEYELRAAALADELAWMTETVREFDPMTPTCLNPPDLFRNHAELGYDFAALAATADVLGASVHAPWHLGFSDRNGHPGLIASAVRLLRETPGTHDVELTEVQLGNVYRSSPEPCDMSGPDVAASLVAPLFAGASTVTGWSLNSRRADVEAGDWALLDDDDRPGERSAAVRKVASLVEALDERIGRWEPPAVDAVALFSERSQAVDLAHSWTGPLLAGRGPNEQVQGTALLVLELLRLGVVAAPAPVSALSRCGARVIVCSQLTAYDEPTADELLQKAVAGSTVVIDGITGQLDLRAVAYRPWPGRLADALGFRVRGLRTAKDGQAVTVHGAPAGRLPLAYAEHEFLDPSWQPDDEVQLAADGRPVLWQRDYGAGRVLMFSGALGPAIVSDVRTRAVARAVLSRAVGSRPSVRPMSSGAVTLRALGERGDAIAVVGPPAERRGGGPLRIALPTGKYEDLWSSGAVAVESDGMVLLPAADGIAVLVGDRRAFD